MQVNLVGQVKFHNSGHKLNCLFPMVGPNSHDYNTGMFYLSSACIIIDQSYSVVMNT